MIRKVVSGDLKRSQSNVKSRGKVLQAGAWQKDHLLNTQLALRSSPHVSF